MSKPIGGRGYKGVGTTHIRVPLPIEDKVRRMVDQFYEGEIDPKPVNQLTTLEQVTDLAKEILSLKKSARVSISKLLQRIYGQEVEL
jgi:hypothetical protein